ncbi:unnamed protein product [Closterium sp. NIES-54]
MFLPDKIAVLVLLEGRRDLITWRESIKPQLDIAGLKGFADSDVPMLDKDDIELRAEFRTAHLLTFMVISRCCSPMVQIALKPCRLRLDANHQAWRFIMSTYQATDDLSIGQLEERLTHLRMGEQESTTWLIGRNRRHMADLVPALCPGRCTMCSTCSTCLVARLARCLM